MNNINRDERTQTIEGYYSRRVFFGDMTMDEVPEDIRESVEKDLKQSGLDYLLQ